MDSIENLLASFYNLPGNNVQDKHKSFRKYLLTIKQNIPNKEAENKFIGELKPRNQLERWFRIDLFLHLKRNRELLEILKTGGKDEIGRVLKNSEFFNDTISQLKPEALVVDLFPFISYVTKMKTINRISKSVKNEELLDGYFTSIEEKYGANMALGLLPGCSKNLIKFKVAKHKPKLSARHVITIYKKDSSFPKFYFSILKNHYDMNIVGEYQSVMEYIATKDGKLFWDIQKEFNLKIDVGKHLTKKIISENMEVLSDGKKCVEWFNKRELLNFVNQKGKFEDFLLSFYPETSKEFFEADTVKHISNILKRLVAEKQYELIQRLFFKKYNISILNYQSEFSIDLLKLMPVYLREPIVQKKLEKSDSYLYLLETKKAIISIKSLLENCSSSDQRMEKLEQLCMTIQMNRRDLKTVTEVLQFVFDRYRNDHRAIKAFLFKFTDDSKNFENLTEEQFKILKQMVPYTLTDYSNRTPAEKVFTAYLMWLMKKNKNYDDHLMDYMKWISTDGMFYGTIFDDEFNKIAVILIKIIDMLDSFKSNDKAYQTLVLLVLQRIFNSRWMYNVRLIPFEKYKHLMKYVFEKNIEYIININHIIYFIKHHNEGIFYKYFWDKYEKRHNFNFLTWFFKHDIKQIEDNLELILTKPSWDKLNSAVILSLKVYSTDSIKKKMIAFLKDKIDYDDVHKSIFYVALLSHLNSDEFLKITKPYMPPEDGKIDVKNALDKMHIHTAVIKSFCNIEDKDMLEIVRKVCIRDYLRYGLQPLYKILYYKSEKEIIPILNSLRKSPVSLRKHSLHLARILLSTAEASKFIAEALEKEENLSIKNVIFKKALDLYVETQTEETWHQTHSYFRLIDANDTLMLDLIIKYIGKIPSKYIIDYIQSTYDIIKKARRKEFTEKAILFARSLPKSVFNTVAFTFLEEIIGIVLKEVFLFDCNEDCYWDYVVHTQSSKSKQLLSCTIEIMKTIVSDVDTGYAKFRYPFNTFITSFCTKILAEGNLEHDELLHMFDLQWTFFPKHCLLDAIIFLKITLAYYESKFDLNRFASLISNLLYKYVEVYDSSIITDFHEQLIKLCYFTEIKNTLWLLAEHLLQTKNHKFNYILVIHLLPNDFPMEDNQHYRWVPIIRSIEEYSVIGRDNISVWYYYDKYLNRNHRDYIWIGNQRFPAVTTTKL